MKIKKSILLVLALTLITSVNASIFGNKNVKGNGNVITETRNTESYDGISCAGSMDFILVSGTEGNIKIEGEENLLEYIIVKVKKGKLIVKVDDDVNLKPSRNKQIKITIPFQDVNVVALAGSGDLWNKDVITANNLKVALAGSGDVVLDIKTTTVEGSLAGSGDLTLKGDTNNLEAKVAGSGDFHGFDLNANHTEVSVAGSGDAKVVSNESLKARVAGSGDIKYKGNPSKEDTKVSGSGSISN